MGGNQLYFHQRAYNLGRTGGQLLMSEKTSSRKMKWLDPEWVDIIISWIWNGLAEYNADHQTNCDQFICAGIGWLLCFIFDSLLLVGRYTRAIENVYCFLICLHSTPFLFISFLKLLVTAGLQVMCWPSRMACSGLTCPGYYCCCSGIAGCIRA